MIRDIYATSMLTLPTIGWLGLEWAHLGVRLSPLCRGAVVRHPAAPGVSADGPEGRSRPATAEHSAGRRPAD